MKWKFNLACEASEDKPIRNNMERLRYCVITEYITMVIKWDGINLNVSVKALSWNKNSKQWMLMKNVATIPLIENKWKQLNFICSRPQTQTEKYKPIRKLLASNVHNIKTAE